MQQRPKYILQGRGDKGVQPVQKKMFDVASVKIFAKVIKIWLGREMLHTGMAYEKARIKLVELYWG